MAESPEVWAITTNERLVTRVQNIIISPQITDI